MTLDHKIRLMVLKRIRARVRQELRYDYSVHRFGKQVRIAKIDGAINEVQKGYEVEKTDALILGI